MSRWYGTQRVLQGLLGGALLVSAAACDTTDDGSDGGLDGTGAAPGDNQFGNSTMPRPNGGASDAAAAGDGADAAVASGSDAGAIVCSREVEVRNVDLLFMVDNSGSMREEQAALRREFPRLIEVLTSGDRDGDGTEDFTPVENLHLAVVSSDLGLVGITGIPLCDGLGDDGVFLNAPSAEVAGCAAAYPSFLSYDVATGDAAQVATDFACISALGTDGCGFEQQLESTLKALWPASDNRVTFLGDVNGFGTMGHGGAQNDGFLRAAGGEETSVLGIVLVTDEEDCSSANTTHFTPDTFLQPGDLLRNQGLNTRCFYNKQNLYDVRQRYVEGFRALRPGAEELVVFAAIVGVPPELVDEDALAAVDFEDAASRDAFYDGILNDPQMFEALDDRGTLETADDNLMPSCDTPNGKAYPPRRILEVARGFGENGLVQSICQDDFGPAVDRIIATIGRTVERGCILD